MRIKHIWVQCLFVSFLIPTVSWAQEVKRTNIWYFGRNAGLNFNTNPPTLLTDGQLNSMEGCATICDSVGQILLYTDGSTIWNKYHKVITGGTNLGGNYTTTQSSIVIPQPRNEHLLYVFSLDAIHLTRELKYSIIDISQNDGEGTIIQKKMPLLSGASEKLTAIKHCNMVDYWIIAHGFNTSLFYVWLMTKDGISPNPKIIDIGSVHGPSESEGIGYMKASPKGDRLALGLYAKNMIELFDFDSYTGEITRPVTLSGDKIKFPYGIEFSPKGKYLYFSGDKKQISQIDISLSTANEILASCQNIVRDNFNWHLSGLQLGPDGKLYISKMNRPHLAVIHHPEEKGSLCQFEDNFIQLNPAMSTIGLPNYIPSYLQPNLFVNIEATLDSCKQTALLRAQISGPSQELRYEWYKNNLMISQGLVDSLSVHSSGDYMVKISSFNTCGATRLESVYSLHVNLSEPLLSDTITATICEGTNYEGYTITGIYRDTFTASSGCDSIRILDLTVLPVIKVNIEITVCAGTTYEGYSKEGIYSDTFVSSNGCDSVRTLTLIFLPVKETNIATSICAGEVYEGYNVGGEYSDVFKTVDGCDSIRKLSLTILPKIHKFTKATICNGELFEGYSASGIFTDVFIAANGCDSVRVLELTVLPKIHTEIKVKMCEGEVYEGYATSGMYLDRFKAVNGCDSTRALHLDIIPVKKSNIEISLCEGEDFAGYNQSGIYKDTLTASNGCDSVRSIKINIHPLIKTDKYISICKGEKYESYDTTGIYTNTFQTKNGCDSIRTLHLTVLPDYYTHSTHIICPDSVLNFHGKIINSSGIYKDTMQSMYGCDSIVSAEFLIKKNSSFLGEDQKICFGNEFILESNFHNTKWFDDDTGLEKKIRNSGMYWAYYPDEDGCFIKDSIYINFDRIVEFPNVFSPNGDLINDCFAPVFDQNEYIEAFEIYIYDRWNNRVYHSNDKNQCWNGESAFQPCAEGVYIYVVQIVSATCGKTSFSGDLTLIR